MTRLDMTRLFVEGIVARTLRRLQRHPERELRGLVDMGLRQSRGRFQRQFFTVAQQMLAQPDSPYFQLARAAVAQTDLEALRTFGMNLGYNGLTAGAKTIRTLEATMGVNIPWIVNIEYTGQDGGLSPADIGALVAEGKGLGIYTYAFFGAAGVLRELEEQLQAEPDCAFLVFVRPGDTDAAQLRWLAGHRNALTVLPLADSGFEEAWAMLRAGRALTAVYALYDDANLGAIVAGTLAARVEAMSGLMLFLLAEKGCSRMAGNTLRDYVLLEREEKRYPFFMMDYYADLLEVDAVISNQSCALFLSGTGEAFTSAWAEASVGMVRAGGLEALIRRAMPPVNPKPAPEAALDLR